MSHLPTPPRMKDPVESTYLSRDRLLHEPAELRHLQEEVAASLGWLNLFVFWPFSVSAVFRFGVSTFRRCARFVTSPAFRFAVLARTQLCANVRARTSVSVLL